MANLHQIHSSLSHGLTIAVGYRCIGVLILFIATISERESVADIFNSISTSAHTEVVFVDCCNPTGHDLLIKKFPGIGLTAPLRFGSTSFSNAQGDVKPSGAPGQSDLKAVGSIRAYGVAGVTPFSAGPFQNGGFTFGGGFGGSVAIESGSNRHQAVNANGGVGASGTIGFLDGPVRVVKYLGYATVGGGASMTVRAGNESVNVTSGKRIVFDGSNNATISISLNGEGYEYKSSIGDPASKSVSGSGAVIIGYSDATSDLFGSDSLDLSSSLDGVILPGADSAYPLSYLALEATESEPAENRLIFPIMESYGTTNPIFGAYQPEVESTLTSAPAIGYKFEVADESPAFAAFVIPDALPGGDDMFRVEFGANRLNLSAGEEIDFTSFDANGIRSFLLTEVASSEVLNPSQPPTFPHGFRFVSEGTGNISVAAITVPELSSGLMSMAVICWIAAIKIRFPRQ